MKNVPNTARKQQQKPSQCIVIAGDSIEVLPYTSRKVHDAFMTMRATSVCRKLGLKPLPKRIDSRVQA